MRTKLLVFSFFAIGLAGLMSSFNTTAESCSVTVTTTLNGAVVAEALVGISATADDRDESVYIFEEETLSNGKITLKGLAAGTYYLDAFISVNEIDYWAESTVSVSAGNADVTMKLVESDY